jgi:hypothetical protein
MRNNLEKILVLKKTNPGEHFQKFLRGEDPDYIISKNESKTRLYLDDVIKIELLIQKYLKLHLLKNISRAQEYHLELKRKNELLQKEIEAQNQAESIINQERQQASNDELMKDQENEPQQSDNSENDVESEKNRQNTEQN